MWTAFLIFMAIPGSGALLAILLRELVRAVRKSRSESEDAERALRIQRDYMIPDWAVEVSEPTGRRRPTLPQIKSDHRGFRDEVSR